MSLSSGGDFNFYMGKGELLTGNQSMDWINKYRKTTLSSKIVVPPGEDGTVLQADSTSNTGFKWVPHEPIANSLRNSVISIVEFLKPLVEERITKDAERLSSLPKIFIRTTSGTIYTIPFTSTDTVQHVIDHLNKTFLCSLITGHFTLTYNSQRLDPIRTLAEYNIENESTLYLTSQLQQSAGKYKTRKNNKNRKSKSNRRRRTLHK